MLTLLNLLDKQDEVETKICKNFEEHFVLQNNNCGLGIIHLNIRSIKKHFEELIIYINTIIEKIDIIVLSETWDVEEVSDFNIPNFNIYYNHSKQNQNDGLIIYIKNTINVSVSTYVMSETILLRCSIKINNITLGLTASYRPPSINTNTYITELNHYIKNLEKNNVEVFIGDININLSNEQGVEVNTYLNNLNENGYISHINKYTRKTENSRSIIDHIFIKTDNNILNKACKMNAAIIETDITDHYSLALAITFNDKINKCQKLTTTIKKIDFNKLNQFLKKETWAEVIRNNSIQDSYDLFIKKFQQIILDSTSIIKVKKCNFKIKPWITQGLINSIKHRDNLKKKLIKNFTAENKVEYTRYRNFLNKLIRNTKNNYYQNEIIQAGTDYKKVWEIINCAANKVTKKVRASDINIINDNNEEICDNEEKANIFNNFFTNIGQKMLEKIETVNELPNDFIVNKHIASSIYLVPVTKTEVIEIINTLKNKSSPGPDGIDVYVIKNVVNHISAPLVHLINLSFTTGILPKQWKESVVSPVYKTGDKKNPNNYRPISVINNIAKIFEKCVKNRLLNFFEKHGVITERQYGFIKNKSTQHAILDLINHLTTNLNKSKKCLAVFLDLAKAFDTVSHRALINRMYNVGIRGPALRILENYLLNRTQYTKVANKISDPCNITIGVPQGTVLGPILFLIYMNNIANLKQFCGHLVSYADDTAMVFVGDTWDEVYKEAEKSLYITQQWLSYSLLNLNVHKCKFLTFSLTSEDQPNNDHLCIHNTKCNFRQNCSCPYVQKEKKVKYLGIIVDQHLRWDDHTNYLNKKIRLLTHIFYSLRDILHKRNFLLVYNSLIESVLRYCIVIWGGLYNNALNNLQRTQNGLLKIILKKPRLYSTELLYSECGIFDIKALFYYHCLLYMFNKYNPELLSNKTYQTRSVSNKWVDIPLYRKSHLQRFVFYVGPKLFNILPPYLKTIKSYNLYKKEIKKFILDKKITKADI